MLARSLALLLALLALALAPAAAHATPVYVVVDGDDVQLRDDPLLPATPVDCATPRMLGSAGLGAEARIVSPVARLAAAGETVRGAIARYQRRGAITAEQALDYRGAYATAIRVRNRLSGQRRAEIAAVIGVVERLARQRSLTASRMAPLFLQLRRNAEWWAKRGGPATPQPPVSKRPCTGKAGLGGARVTFEGDPVVFQWYPGQGLQIQPLGFFGKVNAQAKICTGEAKRGTCNPERVRRMADRMLDISVDRGFLTWEYFFSFGGAPPPWISGLSQATGMQALSRASRILNDPKYLDAAGRALGAFEAAPPRGVRVRASAGNHYVIYSFSSGLRVLNAFLQALVGLYDYGEAANSDRARALFRSGDRQARREIPLADTGAWSRYSAGGSESDLGYHRLVRDFMRSLCDRTKAPTYCEAAERFTRYLHEFTRVTDVSVGKPRAKRVATVAFTMSKVSCVVLRVRRNGELVSTQDRVYGRGRRTMTWVPRRPGRYEIEVDARDLMNHHTVVKREVVVRR